jgi:hypothetical protein
LTEQWRANLEFTGRVKSLLAEAFYGEPSRVVKFCQALMQNKALLTGEVVLYALVGCTHRNTHLSADLVGPGIESINTGHLHCCKHRAQSQSPTEFILNNFLFDFFRVQFDGNTVQVLDVRAVRTLSSNANSDLDQQLEMLSNNNNNKPSFTLNVREVELRHDLDFRFVYLLGARRVCLRLDQDRPRRHLMRMTNNWLRTQYLQPDKLNTMVRVPATWRGLISTDRAMVLLRTVLRNYGHEVLSKFEHEFKHGFETIFLRGNYGPSRRGPSSRRCRAKPY